MRIPLLRLLLVGGGAVVLATAGFAYMASNTVASSYAGEGSGTVSGYNVSAIHYTTQDPPSPLGQGFVTITAVTFILTEQAAPPPGQTGEPTNVDAFLMTGGGPGPNPGPGPAGSVASNGCSLQGSWAPSGSGTYECTFPTSPHGTYVSQVNGLDVEANQ